MQEVRWLAGNVYWTPLVSRYGAESWDLKEDPDLEQEAGSHGTARIGPALSSKRSYS